MNGIYATNTVVVPHGFTVLVHFTVDSPSVSRSNFFAMFKN